METSEPVAPETPVEAPPEPVKASSLIGRGAVLLVCFALGLLGGEVARLRLAPPEADHEAVPRTEERIVAGNPKDALELGDQWFQEGNYAEALANYREVPAAAAGIAYGPVRYRMALCLEGMGSWERALAAYRAVVADAGFRQAHVAAQIAQARVLVRMGRSQDAKHLLYPVLFTTAVDPTQVELLAEARHLLGLALARQLPATETVPEPWRVKSPTSIPVVLSLELPEPAAPSPPAAGAAKTEPLVFAPAKAGEGRVVMEAHLQRQPAKALVDRLIEAAALHGRWTDHAAKLIEARTIHLETQHVLLSDLLTLLADSLDLVCWMDGQTVHLSTAAEAAKEQVEVFRWNVTQIVLRTALAAHPEHRLGAALCLHMGNIELGAGRPAEAISWYEQALRKDPASILATLAHYDIGVVRARLMEGAAARQAFFAAIDLAAGNELAPSAYLQLARLELEDGEIRAAKSHLRRALRNYPGDEAVPVLSLYLAAAQVLGGEHREAHELIARHRRVLQKPLYQSAAAFVDAYALYRSAILRGAARREAADVLASLTPRADEAILGAVEQRSKVQAYLDLGMWTEAAQACARVRPGMQGPLRAPLTLMHADALIHLHRTREASAILEELAKVASSERWNQEARFRLAQIDLDEGRDRECIARCELLWTGHRYHDVTGLLQLWGNAYERLGDFEKAARCFAGNPDASN